MSVWQLRIQDWQRYSSDNDTDHNHDTEEKELMDKSSTNWYVQTPILYLQT